ncbi:unnamed protein product [Rodentolepis nana]|uniref:Secreted protein n=1 Tax=Rodentolepis nana TaxID=102285 RepID=A0A0R3T3F9_RODNA|nr:unnamed protein product [Rodentolepis nana]
MCFYRRLVLVFFFAEVANDALEFTLGIAPSGLEFCFDRRGFLNVSTSLLASVVCC